ncbi:Nif3-like dinuclear metal center hexameric protein [Methanocaldococcus indicus]|uniref:Nif3-like dinuclear metal center hexameric protein n=1 Tax=Methanocaldococcus indicus TaxID=213231 RepID=UPI003C6CF945
MLAEDIIKVIEKFAPKDLAIEGDNVGLLFGREDREVEKIGIALDCSLMVLEKAYKLDIDFLFTHHPILKNPVNRFTNIIYKKLKLLADKDIVLYTAHTNLDICKNGLNDTLAEFFNLKDVEPLYDNGLGRVGIFENSFDEFLNLVKELEKNYVLVKSKEIKDNFKLAVLSGYGLSQKDIEYVSNKADVYLSGDLTHHSKILAEELKLVVVDATHYSTEVLGLKKVKEYLENKLNKKIISLDF